MTRARRPARRPRPVPVDADGQPIILPSTCSHGLTGDGVHCAFCGRLLTDPCPPPPLALPVPPPPSADAEEAMRRLGPPLAAAMMESVESGLAAAARGPEFSVYDDPSGKRIISAARAVTIGILTHVRDGLRRYNDVHG